MASALLSAVVSAMVSAAVSAVVSAVLSAVVSAVVSLSVVMVSELVEKVVEAAMITSAAAFVGPSSLTVDSIFESSDGFSSLQQRRERREMKGEKRRALKDRDGRIIKPRKNGRNRGIQSVFRVRGKTLSLNVSLYR